MRAPISDLDGRDFDTIVIGGGAVGASSAQHLAARGFRTLLVDKGDFASGTTSRSSRLLYCGLAYLSPNYELWRFAYRPRDAYQRLRMARMAMQSRAQLASTMPERLTRHTFFFPFFKDSPFPGWKVDLGYRILSMFGSSKVPLGYHRLTAAEAAQKYGLVKLMDQDRLDSIGVFQEFQYHWAERICVDTVLDAEQCGATVRNYTKVNGLSRLSDGCWRVSLEDTRRPGETARIEAKALVNTAGPWADLVTSLAVPRPKKKRLVGIKGVNLLVKLPDSCRGLGMETISRIGQPFYCMPWGDHHFFGPTETVFDDDPDNVRVLPEEIEFILGEANHVFPSLNLRRADVVYSWCGVRPRTSSSNEEGVRAMTIHDMSDEGMPNAITVTGTPIMVHRRAGQRVADEIARRFAPSGNATALSYEAKLPPGPPQTSCLPIEALRHAAANEYVETLIDLLFRRVLVGWQPGMGIADARRAAELVSDILCWDEARIASEVEDYRRFVAEHFAPAALAQPESRIINA